MYLSLDLECDGSPEIESCTASSQSNDNWGCNYVIIGEREWEINPSDTTSPWIQIFLKHEYALRQLRIKQSKNDANWFSEIDIEFSDGSILGNHTLPMKHELPNQSDWITIILPIGTHSRFVKIVRKRSHGPDTRGGLAKIEVVGCIISNFVFSMNANDYACDAKKILI